MPYLIALAVVALVVLAIFGLAGIGAAAFFKSVILSKGGGGGAIPVPVPVGKWVIQYSQGCPPSLADQGDGTFAVDIPNSPGSIHYVVTSAPQIGATITMTFAIEGAGTVIPVPGSDEPPAKIRLYIQRQGDMMTGQGEYQFYRFWSNAKVDIPAPGEYTLTAPVDPTQWHPVGGSQYTPGPNYEQDKANGFALCLANLAYAGFTFGGASFDGHGDVALGQVRFVLRSYQ